MTELPWKCLRSVLQRNEKAAYQNLCSLQRSFDKNPGLEEEFNKQVEEMIERGAAVVLSEGCCLPGRETTTTFLLLGSSPRTSGSVSVLMLHVGKVGILVSMIV